METGGTVLGLVGSPNRDGRTFEIVSAVLKAAELAGARTELVQMADHVVTPCKDCQPWKCMSELRCQYADQAFEYLSERLLTCGALVLGTPIYWWDTSAMVKYLILKMFRVYALSGPLAGLPALGVGIAGGTGNGLISGLRPVYHFFQMLQVRSLDPFPITRFNWQSALIQAADRGERLASMSGKRHPFESFEERLLWYENLPYLTLRQSGERRLLAALAADSLPEGVRPELARELVRADGLAAEGEHLESLKATTAVYKTALKRFEKQP